MVEAAQRQAPGSELGIDPNVVERPFHIEEVLESGGMALVINDLLILSSEQGKGRKARRDQILMITRNKDIHVGMADSFASSGKPESITSYEPGTIIWYVRKTRPDRSTLFVGRNSFKIICLDIQKGERIRIRVESPIELQTEVIGWSENFAAVLAERQAALAKRP